jgi:hypothetical protein
VPGIFVELTGSPPGTLTGIAVADFPPVGNDTIPQYQAKLILAFRKLCAYAGRPRVGNEPIPPGWFLDGTTLRPLIIDISISLSSLSPITISDVTILEGAVRCIQVGG